MRGTELNIFTYYFIKLSKQFEVFPELATSNEQGILLQGGYMPNLWSQRWDGFSDSWATNLDYWFNNKDLEKCNSKVRKLMHFILLRFRKSLNCSLSDRLLEWNNAICLANWPSHGKESLRVGALFLATSLKSQSIHSNTGDSFSKC